NSSRETHKARKDMSQNPESKRRALYHAALEAPITPSLLSAQRSSHLYCNEPKESLMPSGIPLFSAVIQSLQAGYSRNALRGDLLAGVTVGIIAIPLAMALAIAVGVPPQHGLYTVLIAAPLIALCGGSRFNISG